MTEREARVSEASCGIFLTAADLRALGVYPEGADAVVYTVTENGIVVSDRESEG